MSEPTIQQLMTEQDALIERLNKLQSAGNDVLIKYNFAGIMQDTFASRPNRDTNGAELTGVLLDKLQPIIDSVTAEEAKSVLVSYLLTTWADGIKKAVMLEMVQRLAGEHQCEGGCQHE